MPAQIRVKNFTRSGNFAPGAILPLELPRVSDINSLFIRLSGTFTYPSGATGNLTTLGPTALIQRVEVVGNGQVTFMSIPGWALNIMSARSLDPVNGAFNMMTPPAANAVGTVDALFFLDFSQYDGFRPKDSSLRVSGFNNLELRITFAPWVVAFTNAASVPTTFALTVDVDGDYTAETDPKATMPKFVVKRTSVVVDAATSNSNYLLNLPAGNAIRSVQFYTHVNGVASDAILNKVAAMNGVDTRVIASAKSLQMRMRGYRDRPVGFNEVDFARESYLGAKASNAWATSQNAQPQINLDFTGQAGAKIEVVITEYVGA